MSNAKSNGVRSLIKLRNQTSYLADANPELFGTAGISGCWVGNPAPLSITDDNFKDWKTADATESNIYT